MDRVEPIEQAEDDSHEIDVRVSDLQEQVEKKMTKKTIQGRDKKIQVISDISEPNSQVSNTKKASQDLFASTKTEQSSDIGINQVLSQLPLQKTFTEANRIPISKTKTEFVHKTASLNVGQDYNPRHVSNVGISQRQNLSGRDLCYRTSQPSQHLDEPQDDNDDEEVQSSPFDSASLVSLGHKTGSVEKQPKIVPNNFIQINDTGVQQMSLKPEEWVILPKPQVGNTFLTPNPNMEKESSSPATSGGITPSNLNKNEAKEAPVQSHGIKKINIRTKFKPNTGKVNLQGTMFAPDPISLERDRVKINLNQKKILNEDENPFPESQNKNPFLKSETESFIVPSNDVSTPVPINEQQNNDEIPNTIEVEELMSPEKIPNVPQKLQKNLSEMSDTAQQFVQARQAIQNRKQEQNKKVSNLKSKFKINVKVKIPIEVPIQEPQDGGQSPELNNGDLQPFNLEQDLDNAHNVVKMKQDTLGMKSVEMKMGKNFSAAQPQITQSLELFSKTNGEPQEFYSARSRVEGIETARDDPRGVQEDDAFSCLTSQQSFQPQFLSQNTFAAYRQQDSLSGSKVSPRLLSQKTTIELREEEEKQTTRKNELEKELKEIHDAHTQETAALRHAVDLYKKLLNQNDQDEQQVEEMKQQLQVDIGFMFASPIVTRQADQTLKAIPSISYKPEVDNIKAEARLSKRQIIFRQDVAKKDTFDRMLSLQPKVLHISCHGFRSPEESLLFEIPGGEGIRVKKVEFREKLKTQAEVINLVYLASCTSEFVGRMFFDFGVQHVICIKAGQYVNDQAAVNFTRLFYKLLFQGKQICHAFEYAKTSVEWNHEVRDGEMFKLFKPAVHSCYPIDFGKRGEFRCESDHSLIKEMQSNRRQSICREFDLYKLNSKILQYWTPVTFLYGEPGVGKSHLLRDACAFMQQRKEFCGIVMLACKQVKEVKVMLRQLRAIIVRKCNLGGKKSTNQVVKNSNTKKSTEQILVDFFNLQYDLEKKSEGFSAFNSRHFLLCIDQADSLIEKDVIKFEKFLNQMTIQCKNLKIVVSAAQDMHIQHKKAQKNKDGETGSKRKISSKVLGSATKMTLDPLEPLQTVEMFTDKAKLSLARIPAEKREFNEAYIKFIISDFHYQNRGKKDSEKKTKNDRYEIWKNQINMMRVSDLKQKMSEHELFKELLKGNSHEIVQLVDHVIFLHPADDSKAADKLTCLFEYYKDLKKNQDKEAPASASEIVVPTMIFQFLDLFAAINMMPGGATLNQIRQILPEDQSKNYEVLDLIFEDKLFDEDEIQIQTTDDTNEQAENDQPAEKLYKLKPTFARLFDDRIKEMMKEKSVLGVEDNKLQILKVCDRLCNYFLQNRLLEVSADEEGEKIKRSRISIPVNNTRRGLEIELAEASNLDNCFQVCIDNLDENDDEREGEIRVFQDAKPSLATQHGNRQTESQVQFSQSPSIASSSRNSRMGGSILCSQFIIGSLSLVADQGNGNILSSESSNNLFATAQEVTSQEPLFSKSQVLGKQSNLKTNQIGTNNTIGEESDEEEEELHNFAKIAGFTGADSMVMRNQVEQDSTGGRRSTLPFRESYNITHAGLGVRGLFMLNLIKCTFIEQQFDYCASLSQKLLSGLENMGELLEPHHCLLKANAIRFRWLVKAHMMPYNRKSKDFDSDKLAHDLLEIYENLSEACEMFEKGLPDKEDSKTLSHAKGLCYFQQGMILERVHQLYSPKKHSQKELNEHTKHILEDFELAQKEFKTAKSMQGVLQSIEHRSINDTIGQKSYAQYHKMKLDAMKKLHPTMKRADSNQYSANFLNSFVMQAKQFNSARDRRNTTAQTQVKNAAPEIDLFDDIEQSDDPLREIFDAETVLLIDLVTN